MKKCRAARGLGANVATIGALYGVAHGSIVSLCGSLFFCRQVLARWDGTSGLPLFYCTSRGPWLVWSWTFVWLRRSKRTALCMCPAWLLLLTLVHGRVQRTRAESTNAQLLWPKSLHLKSHCQRANYQSVTFDCLFRKRISLTPRPCVAVKQRWMHWVVDWWLTEQEPLDLQLSHRYQVSGSDFEEMGPTLCVYASKRRKMGTTTVSIIRFHMSGHSQCFYL